MNLAIALRPELYSPEAFFQIVRNLDSRSSVTHVFIPDISGGPESIELSASALAVTKRVHVGTGVIRILEHDPLILNRRVHTLQYISGGRFVVGVGTGSPSQNPSEKIELMVKRLSELVSSFKETSSSFNPESYSARAPETFVATLKIGIAKKVVGKCDGLLLNFCSSQYARNLISAVNESKNSPQNRNTFACYMKVFFSREKNSAQRILFREFLNYDRLPQYHKMFEIDGIAHKLSALVKLLNTNAGSDSSVLDDLHRISLSNPTDSEFAEYVKTFSNAGVNLPCIYPYFSEADDQAFRIETVKRIVDVLEV